MRCQGLAGLSLPALPPGSPRAPHPSELHTLAVGSLSFEARVPQTRGESPDLAKPQFLRQ